MLIRRLGDRRTNESIATFPMIALMPMQPVELPVMQAAPAPAPAAASEPAAPVGMSLPMA